MLKWCFLSRCKCKSVPKASITSNRLKCHTTLTPIYITLELSQLYGWPHLTNRAQITGNFRLVSLFFCVRSPQFSTCVTPKRELQCTVLLCTKKLKSIPSRPYPTAKNRCVAFRLKSPHLNWWFVHSSENIWICLNRCEPGSFSLQQS